ncbi:MAG TPA: ketose-bisphosphate aldolase [Candidatus Yonathbacteria bacterium]|nr:ketose-bisphosphate aldolase [Candidatus Yonathbacteria bacterium]
MKTLKETIAKAEAEGVAIGHFNISNIEGLWGIFNAARELDVSVIIGLSEGERDFVGVKQAVALVKSLREEFNYPIFINADHTYSVERVKEAIDAGFDAVIYDGVKESIEDNIKNTKLCVEYARESGREVLIEAELGYIGTSSKLLDEIPEGASQGEEMLTKPEEAKQFVEETGVDLLSPAVGNMHGMLKGSGNPELNIPRIKEIREVAGVPLVLHGGSGISEGNFKDAIASGISTVHINTEIRVAYRDATKAFLNENPDEIAPYRIMKPAVEAVQAKVLERLKLFSGKE